MFYQGSSSAQRRIANYGAKVRAYTGTGTVPDYAAPVVQ